MEKKEGQPHSWTVGFVSNHSLKHSRPNTKPHRGGVSPNGDASLIMAEVAQTKSHMGPIYRRAGGTKKKSSSASGCSIGTSSKLTYSSCSLTLVAGVFHLGDRSWKNSCEMSQVPSQIPPADSTITSHLHHHPGRHSGAASHINVSEGSGSSCNFCDGLGPRTTTCHSAIKKSC